MAIAQLLQQSFDPANLETADTSGPQPDYNDLPRCERETQARIQRTYFAIERRVQQLMAEIGQSEAEAASRPTVDGWLQAGKKYYRSIIADLHELRDQLFEHEEELRAIVPGAEEEPVVVRDICLTMNTLCQRVDDLLDPPQAGLSGNGFDNGDGGGDIPILAA